MLAAVVVGAIALASSSAARADVTARAAVDAGLLAYEHHGAETEMRASAAGGVRGALGYQYALSPSWYLGPELALGYLKVGDAYSRNLVRAQAGASIAWLASADFATNVFAHAGYGHAWGVDGDAMLSRRGPVFEVGGAFYFRASRAVSFGPDLAVGTMLASTGSGTDATPWFLAGVHVSAAFGGPSRVESDVATR